MSYSIFCSRFPYPQYCFLHKDIFIHLPSSFQWIHLCTCFMCPTLLPMLSIGSCCRHFCMMLYDWSAVSSQPLSRRCKWKGRVPQARSVPQGPAVFLVPVSGENQLVPGLDSGAHVINRAALGRLEFSPQLCTTRIWVLCF